MRDDRAARGKPCWRFAPWTPDHRRKLGPLTLLVGCWLAAGCAPASPSALPGDPVRGAPVQFEFYGPESTRVSLADVRGRVTVLAFGTSYALATQLLAEQLQGLLTSEVPRINVVLAMMEPAQYQLFAGTFKESLGLTYPVVIVDDGTLQGLGPFGKFKAMPAVAVLDRDGRLSYIDEGVLSMERIKQEVKAVQPAR